MSVLIVVDREHGELAAPPRGFALAKAMGWNAEVVGVRYESLVSLDLARGYEAKQPFAAQRREPLAAEVVARDDDGVDVETIVGSDNLVHEWAESHVCRTDGAVVIEDRSRQQGERHGGPAQSEREMDRQCGRARTDAARHRCSGVETGHRRGVMASGNTSSQWRRACCGLALAGALCGGSAAAQPTTDTAEVPISTDWGARVLDFSFPGLEVGIAEYPQGPTGVTVLHFPDGAAMAMDVRGGSPGVVGDYGFVHAISLAGGSLLGLEAAAGVAARLLERRGDQAQWDTIPLVSGGIVYDFGGRANNIYPDTRLGRAALDNAKPGRFPLGARGAGIAVTVGNGFAFDRGERAGQGAAFREIGGVKIFACTVLNAVGAVHDRDGAVVLGHVDPETGRRSTFAEDLEQRLAAYRESSGQNTTLTVVVTNQTVRGHDLAQLGRQVHSSMARAVQPFHTRDDGDVLWTVSTAEVDVPEWSLTALGVAASEVVWDAVLEAHP